MRGFATKKHIISLPSNGSLRLWQGTSGLHRMYCVNQLVQGVRLRELNVVCGSLISAVKLGSQKNGSILGSFLRTFLSCHLADPGRRQDLRERGNQRSPNEQESHRRAWQIQKSGARS